MGHTTLQRICQWLALSTLAAWIARRHLHEGRPAEEDAEYADTSGDDQSCR